MISVSGLCLCLRDTVLYLTTLEIVIARLLRRKLYAWCNVYRKKGEC